MSSQRVSVQSVRKRRNKSGSISGTSPKHAKQQLECTNEEDEAVSRNSADDIEIFSDTVSSMKSLMKDILDMKLKNINLDSNDIADEKVQFSMLFLALKKLNRLDKFRCQKATDSIQQAMQKVDDINLQLQNLHYEAVHLKKEITKCLEFKSLDEDVNLIPVDTFFEEAPEDVTRPSETKADEHQLMLARLQWELQQRKELAKKLADSKKKEQKVLLETAEKQDHLENLKPTLKSILKAAAPLQNELGVPLLASKTLHKMAKHLPQPLCVLFVQSSAYMDACDGKIDVSVKGDVQEVISLKTTEDEVDEDSDSDQEETGKRKRRRNSHFQKIEARRKKLLQKHPLHVEITIKGPEYHSLCVKFYYLISLRIATVEVEYTPGSTVSKTEFLLTRYNMLSCLFPNDLGTTSPNPANHYQLNKLSMNEFGDYITEIGRPYLWVQRLCGLKFIDIIEQSQTSKASHSLSSNHMEETIVAIKSRFETRIALQQQLFSLAKGNIPVPAKCVSQFCSKIVARLSSFRPISFEEISDDFKGMVKMLVEDEIVASCDSLFLATFERSTAKMTVLMSISPSYPETVPYFIVTIQYQGSHSSLNNSNVRDMEQEVNVFWEDLIKNCERSEILVNQLERLRMCFDVYLETAVTQALSEGPCEFQKEKLFTQTCKGRERSLPYVFLPSLGIFTHRS